MNEVRGLQIYWEFHEHWRALKFRTLKPEAKEEVDEDGERKD